MKVFARSNDTGRGRWRRNPVAAWVERLERRSLPTLQVNPITMVAGQYFDGPIASFTTGDVAGTLADFQATIYWMGAQQVSTGGSIAPNGPGNYVIYGSDVEPRPGSYPINVVLTGANKSTAQASGTATLTDAPLSTTPTSIAASLQVAFSGPVGSFSTSNSAAAAGDFRASIDWGDGTPPTPGGIAVSSSFYFGPTFNIVGEHTYATAGTFPVTVSVTSPGGQVNIINSTVVVTANPVSLFPAPVTGNAGQPLVGVTVATFIDPYTTEAATDFRAIVNWGDGVTDVGTIAGRGNGLYNVLGDHTYATAGNDTITVEVVRVANGQAVATTSTAQIGSPSPVFAFAGGLAPVPGNGPFIASGYASTRHPTFDRTAAAFAVVQLFGQPSNGDTAQPLGETVAGPDGRWSLTVGPLRRGTYLITARITPPSGYPSEDVTLTQDLGIFSIALAPVRRTSRHPVAAEVGSHAGRSGGRPSVVDRAPGTTAGGRIQSSSSGPRSSPARLTHRHVESDGRGEASGGIGIEAAANRASRGPLSTR